MAQPNFSDFEAVIRTTIEPEIQRQFEQSQSLYTQFARGGKKLNSSGYRIPYYPDDNTHPWTRPDGLESYMQLMRGELELPHAPAKCSFCRNAFDMQINAVRGEFKGLGKRGALSLSSRRNDIRRMLRELAQEQAA